MLLFPLQILVESLMILMRLCLSLIPLMFDLKTGFKPPSIWSNASDSLLRSHLPTFEKTHRQCMFSMFTKSLGR